jgi:hypothetical protein
MKSLKTWHTGAISHPDLRDGAQPVSDLRQDEYGGSLRRGPSKLNVSMRKGPPFSRTTAALICLVFLLIELFSSVETHPCCVGTARP